MAQPRLSLKLVIPKFGEYIREKRKEKRVSLRKLAGQLGINFTYLSKIENNELAPPSEKKILALAEALELDADYLFHLADKPTGELAHLAVQPHMPMILRAAKDLTDDERREVVDYIVQRRLQRQSKGE